MSFPFPLLFKAVGFLADASADSVKLAARSSALVSATKSAVWLMTWTGDEASKLKLCGQASDQGHLCQGLEKVQFLVSRTGMRADGNSDSPRFFFLAEVEIWHQ